MGVIAIFVSLVLLIYLAYRGLSVILLAPLMALLAVLLSGEGHLLAAYTEVFMKHMSGFVKNFFPLFLLGAVFGALMSASRFAESIAHQISRVVGSERAILSVVLSCAVLTYGGVSIFVVAFAVFPIALSLFQQAKLSKRLIPAALALGSFTFTMTALPGTPQIQNSIPMPYFGTTLYAAPTLGFVCGGFIFLMGVLWLNYRGRQLQAKGEVFELGATTPFYVDDPGTALPAKWRAWVPVSIVLLGALLFSKVIFPGQDLSFLKVEPYSTSPEKLIGSWALISALALAILSIFVLSWSERKRIMKATNEGVQGSLLAVINTASEVGYGNVIAGLTAFAIVKTWVLDLSANPLISASLATTVLAGVTGSASGGLSIALGSLGQEFLQLTQAQGISPEVLHRMTAIACGGLDSLPHNGAVITLLTICGLTHRQSYADVGMTTLVIPFGGLALGLVLASFGVV